MTRVGCKVQSRVLHCEVSVSSITINEVINDKESM